MEKETHFRVVLKFYCWCFVVYDWMVSCDGQSVKYSINSYLNVNIAFFKELQNYCRSIGIKYDEINKYISDNECINILSNKFINDKNLDDLFSLEYQMRRSNISTSVLSATIRRLSELE